jgi:hypothetical protein
VSHTHDRTIQISSALEGIRTLAAKASEYIDEIVDPHNPPEDTEVGDLKRKAGYFIESALIGTISLVELLGWRFGLRLLKRTYAAAKAENFVRAKFNGDVSWDESLERVWQIVDCVEKLHGFDGASVQRDLVEILRSTQYSITDRDCFPNPPSSENDVHRRIEAVLRCVFPSLLHKPPIAKPIKNFVPDTGIPSLATLVEYKFISTQEEAKQVADEILADTRGYVSPEWKSFLYVIYETTRIKPEHAWRQLLRDCNTAENADVIVICGETLPEGHSKIGGIPRATGRAKTKADVTSVRKNRRRSS